MHFDFSTLQLSTCAAIFVLFGVTKVNNAAIFIHKLHLYIAYVSRNFTWKEYLKLVSIWCDVIKLLCVEGFYIIF